MTENDIHKEHRKRVKEKFLKYGLGAFADHEVLELLLFFGIPYRDTNGLGHELLNRFGSVSGVLETELCKLKEVPGIGNNAAVLISLMPQLFARYGMDRMSAAGTLNDPAMLKEYLINHFIGATREHLELFTFDGSMKLVGHRTVSAGALTGCPMDMEVIAQSLFNNSRVSSFILAHNHPSGNPEPSPTDISLTKEVYHTFRRMNRTLNEHYIVADGYCVPILKRALRGT